MKIAIYCGKFRHGRTRKLLEAFSKGLKKHGVPTVVGGSKESSQADVAVIWGTSKNDIIEKQKKNGRHFLVFENAYIKRKYTRASIGYDGLNGEADFCNEYSPSDRWKALMGERDLPPWNTPSEGPVLLIGQVHRDKAVLPVDFAEWANSTSRTLAQNGCDVLYRRHPREQSDFIPHGARLSMVDKITDDLARCSWAVSLSSTVGVDAFLHGTRIVSMDPRSMVYRMTSHDPLKPSAPNRMQWCYDIAYCQWVIGEMSNGKAWEHLRKKLEQ